MNATKYKQLTYLIVITILATIVLQGYWNYKNYLRNKQIFVNSMQVSLDNALDTYYATIVSQSEIPKMGKMDTLKFDGVKQVFVETLEGENINALLDSIQHQMTTDYSQLKIQKQQVFSDSLKLIEGITTIFVSIQDDELNYKKLHKRIKEELTRKNIQVAYVLEHLVAGKIMYTNAVKNQKQFDLQSATNSKFLKPHEKILLRYPNATSTVLKSGFFGMLLSVLLSAIIIFALLFLLKTIRNQKKISEIKDDFISNITHEFKTPITTISVALESVKAFNVIDDKEKTNQYLEVSTQQLGKLTQMVERLLETATLNSDQLLLQKEVVNISELIGSIVVKHDIVIEEKTLMFNVEDNQVFCKIDAFHFENVIHNLIDNAIKYGGDQIKIDCINQGKFTCIKVVDNGSEIDKEMKDKIFEQFYRVPNGDIHNVKGFGIGLYYAKKIIELHQGTLTLELENKQTTFKILLPNE